MWHLQVGAAAAKRAMPASPGSDHPARAGLQGHAGDHSNKPTARRVGEGGSDVPQPARGRPLAVALQGDEGVSEEKPCTEHGFATWGSRGALLILRLLCRPNETPQPMGCGSGANLRAGDGAGEVGRAQQRRSRWRHERCRRRGGNRRAHDQLPPRGRADTRGLMAVGRAADAPPVAALQHKREAAGGAGLGEGAGGGRECGRTVRREGGPPGSAVT